MISQHRIVFAGVAKQNRIAFRAIRAKTMLAMSVRGRFVARRPAALLASAARHRVVLSSREAAQTNAIAVEKIPSLSEGIFSTGVYPL